MIVMMGISLFTSREILRILGVDDFGLYNVVAGIVVLFAFLNTSMVRASQRFLSYYIGKGNFLQVRNTFSTCINVNILLSLIVIIISETIGLWFVNSELHVPEGRVLSMNIVYQFSILTFVLNIFKTPYNSAIIAYEEMSFYAYASILEAILKLLIVYVLLISQVERLSIYACLLCVVSIIDLFVYIIFCWHKFGDTCKYKKYWDKRSFNELFGFSGWSMVSGIANLSAQQGGNILLNLFCGLTANASFGIASQVGNAVLKLTTNFSTAFAPQITKLFAINDKKNLYTLIYRASLISYYLMLIFAIPLFFQINIVLDLWLVDVPEFAAVFCILIIVFELIDAFQAPLIHLMYSTGKIKLYVIWLGLLTLLNLPISYGLLSVGKSVYCVLAIRALINLISAFFRIMHLNHMINFPIAEYSKEVLRRAVPITIVLLFVAYVFNLIIDNTMYGVILYFILSIFTSIVIILSCGFSKNDRTMIIYIIKKKLCMLFG